MKKWCVGSCCCLLASSLFAWNAEGHRLVAQIALDYMTPAAKARFQVAHPLLDKSSNTPSSFTEAAVWFDTLRGMGFGLEGMHYVDIPVIMPGFSADEPLEIKPLNGLMAYNGARQTLLLGDKSTLEQIIVLRILLHVIADLHQPLHAATRRTENNPNGDAGGNKTRLPYNQISRNLHTYWDKAGGFLSHEISIQMRAHMLEKKWPCDVEHADKNPVHWLAESHGIAEQKAYGFKHQKHLDADYQAMVYDISQRRLATAGCRLAGVLNEIEVYGFPWIG